MKALGWIFAGLLVIGFISGAGDSDSRGDSPGDSGYTGTYHDDENGNPVPDDCEDWAASSDDPFGEDPYGQELCEAWD